MMIFFIFITLIYVLLLGALLLGWHNLRVFQLKNNAPEVKFSIIIPYRNEAENLPDILGSILNLKYPASHYEVLLVNDSSSDNSFRICSGFKKLYPNIRIILLENIRNSASPKKDAITTGIKKAAFPYIITTDADCILPELWLQAFNEKILESDPKLIAGPVAINKYSTRENPDFNSKPSIPPEWEKSRERRSFKYLHAFQEMDFLSLQVAGAGGFGLQKAFMGNGANFCYSKEAFLELDGFSGNGEFTSGDDVFLIQKFEEKKWETAFLKCREAIVLTKPQPNLTSLISQRIRWAAKTPAYKSNFAKLIGLVVLFMNLSLVVGCFLVFLELIPYRPVLFSFLFKFIIDFLILYASASFFGKKDVLRNYFWSSLIYPFFSSAIAILSQFKKFEWKGRVSKK